MHISGIIIDFQDDRVYVYLDSFWIPVDCDIGCIKHASDSAVRWLQGIQAEHATRSGTGATAMGNVRIPTQYVRLGVQKRTLQAGAC